MIDRAWEGREVSCDFPSRRDPRAPAAVTNSNTASSAMGPAAHAVAAVTSPATRPVYDHGASTISGTVISRNRAMKCRKRRRPNGSQISGTKRPEVLRPCASSSRTTARTAPRKAANRHDAGCDGGSAGFIGANIHYSTAGPAGDFYPLPRYITWTYVPRRTLYARYQPS